MCIRDRPSIIPTIASSMIWTQILGKDGLINQGLALIGIQGPAWLNTPSTALYGLILMGVWGIGNTIIIYLSGLQGVGEEDVYKRQAPGGAHAPPHPGGIRRADPSAGPGEGAPQAH